MHSLLTMCFIICISMKTGMCRFVKLQVEINLGSWFQILFDRHLHYKHTEYPYYRCFRKHFPLLILNNSKSLKLVLAKFTLQIAEQCTILLGVVLIQNLCSVSHKLSSVLKFDLTFWSNFEPMCKICSNTQVNMAVCRVCQTIANLSIDIVSSQIHEDQSVHNGN